MDSGDWTVVRSRSRSRTETGRSKAEAPGQSLRDSKPRAATDKSFAPPSVGSCGVVPSPWPRRTHSDRGQARHRPPKHHPHLLPPSSPAPSIREPRTSASASSLGRGQQCSDASIHRFSSWSLKSFGPGNEEAGVGGDRGLCVANADSEAVGRLVRRLDEARKEVERSRFYTSFLAQLARIGFDHWLLAPCNESAETSPREVKGDASVVEHTSEQGQARERSSRDCRDPPVPALARAQGGGGAHGSSDGCAGAGAESTGAGAGAEVHRGRGESSSGACSVEVVVYGLGSVAESRVSRAQLALACLIRDRVRRALGSVAARTPSAVRCMVYDPVLDWEEQAALGALGLESLDRNHDGFLRFGPSSETGLHRVAEGVSLENASRACASTTDPGSSGSCGDSNSCRGPSRPRLSGPESAGGCHTCRSRGSGGCGGAPPGASKGGRVIFVMPHCESFLYNNVVVAHEHSLDHIAILGNSFSTYEDRWQVGPLPEPEPSGLLKLFHQRNFKEESVDPCDFPLVSAFNDMSWHFFQAASNQLET